jgi:glutathione synthase/RimK-type ligase-like ATP-grasp enzyme
VLDPSRLHPADVEFANLGLRAFRESLFHMLSPEAFWVNPREAATISGLKIYQHHVARAVGLATPDSLYTNDPEQIRAFIRRHGGRIAYKPLKSLSWRTEKSYYMPFTSMITEEQLVADELLKLTPGIYQAVVPKAYELRVTVMGHHVFPVRIHSQQTQRGQDDWRKAHGELKMDEVVLPEPVRALCLRLMERLKLVFGAFDFIVTPEGEHVFLEVNQMGQFLFLENEVEVPLLDAFCELLSQARPDFTWSRDRATLRYADMAQAIEEQLKHAEGVHVKPLTPKDSWYEGELEKKA